MVGQMFEYSKVCLLTNALIVHMMAQTALPIGGNMANICLWMCMQ